MLTEDEVKNIDPRTHQQRGCNTCWETIQEAILGYTPVEEDEEGIEISLEEILDYENHATTFQDEEE